MMNFPERIFSITSLRGCREFWHWLRFFSCQFGNLLVGDGADIFFLIDHFCSNSPNYLCVLVDNAEEDVGEELCTHFGDEVRSFSKELMDDMAGGWANGDKVLFG